MAFQTPPTFVDGQVLSASQLNILASNQNYLSGIASSVNPGFREVSIDGSSDWEYYSLVHAHDWLYVRVHLQDDHTNLRIYTSADNFGNAIGTVTTANPAGEDVEESIDISSAGLTKGAWLRYGLRGNSNGECILRYFAEDDGDRTA